MSLLGTLTNNRVAKSVVGGALNALPGYSTLGANISNPNVNYQGQANPGYTSAKSTPQVTQQPQQQAQQIIGGNLSASNAGGSGAATSDPNLAAQYADQANQLQGQYGTLDNQLTNGQQTINNSYGQSLGGINDQFALQQHTYDTQRQQNSQDYLNTSNNARTQVRAQSNALQRLLGMNGAGNSSASSEQAPYAAALAGSQLINGAQSTYAKNAANQDNNFAQTKLTTENAKKKLAQDKADKEQKLQQDVASSRATLLDQIRQANINHDLALGKNYQQAATAQAGTQGQVQNLLSQIQQLGKVNPISYDSSQIQYQTPDMAQYSLDGGPTIQGDGTGAQSNVDPTFLSLLSDPKKKTDQYGQLINI